MCFTIEVHLTRKSIEQRFSVDTSALYDFDFNYFYRAFANPMIPVITQEEPGRADLMEWGLIPFWVKNGEMAEKIRKGTYNARAETLHAKPSFREAFKKGRCLVLAHGFFEWQHEKGEKIPWYIRLKNDAPFAFAGLAENWVDPETGEIKRTCSIITTRANPMMEKIHNTQKRMPVILPPEKEKNWIDGSLSTSDTSQLLIPYDQDQMEAYTVSKAVSNPAADPADPSIIRPVKRTGEDTLFQ